MSFYDNHIGFDLETDGILPEYALQPWRVGQEKAWVTSLVWIRYRNGRAEVNGGIKPTKEMLIEMLEYALQKDLRIVGWNITFDIQWLLAYGLADLVHRVKWLDGMLLWRHWNNEPEYEAKPGKRKSRSLKAFVPEFFPEHAGYETDVVYHNPTEEQLAALHEYNIKDVVFTLKGAKLLWDRLNEKRRRCALIEAECLSMVAETNLNGMLVDVLTLQSLRADLYKKSRMKLAKLARFDVDETIVRSPAKLRKVMFEDWGLKPLKQTAKGAHSTDKESLHELAISSGDWRVKCIRTYRETLNAIGKFVDSPLEAAAYNGDGRARPKFVIFSTYTSRFTVGSKQKKFDKQRKTMDVEVEE